MNNTNTKIYVIKLKKEERKILYKIRTRKTNRNDTQLQVENVFEKL